jgi:hypothetical protein
MSDIKGKSGGLHDLAGLGGLALALGRKGHIVPSSKEVQFVPRTLAVAEEDKISKHIAIVELPSAGGELSLSTEVEWLRIKFSVTRVVMGL